jgi:NAD(P)-dependent dehydrogenase (short-subunit alcohol dehydrogenase family)
MIYVTHDQVEAMTMADKIVVLRAGISSRSAAPAGAVSRPRNTFVAGFIGSPKMNLIDGRRGGAWRARPSASGPSISMCPTTEGKWKGTVGVAEHLGSDTFIHVHGVDGCRPDDGARGRRESVRHGDGLPDPAGAQPAPLRRPGAADRMMRLAGKSALITGARAASGWPSPRPMCAKARGSPSPTSTSHGPRDAAAAIGDAAIAVEWTSPEAGQHRRRGRRDRRRLRADRHPDQQRRRLHRRPDRRDHARGLSAVFDINVAGTLFTMQAVARHMIERGVKGGDHQHGKPGRAAGRAAGRGLLRDQGGRDQPDAVGGAEPDQHGINVNAISPGVVDGEHWDGVDAFFAKYENKAPGQKKAEVGAGVPFGRMGTAEDLTGMAVFLASDEAATSSPRPTTWMADNG